MPKFNVPDMSCGHCKAAIEKAVAAVDPAATLSFDMESRTVEIGSALDVATLTQTLAAEGYPSSVAA